MLGFCDQGGGEGSMCIMESWGCVHNLMFECDLAIVHRCLIKMGHDPKDSCLIYCEDQDDAADLVYPSSLLLNHHSSSS